MLAPAWDRGLVLEAFCHGARGVISERDAPDIISKALKCVHEGHIWANKEQLVHLVGALQLLRKEPKVAPRHSLLSERENQIAMLLVEGYTNQEIASQLYLSKFTVKNHIRNLFGKLGVSNRTQAVSYLIREADAFGPDLP
jgi:DNA-binding NarL/FixJ family response regulator